MDVPGISFRNRFQAKACVGTIYNLSCVDPCFIADQILEQLPLPRKVGKTKLGGIDLNKPHMRWVAEAVLALAPSPRGFTASDLAGEVRAFLPSTNSKYYFPSSCLRHQETARQTDCSAHRKNRSDMNPFLVRNHKPIAALVLLRDKAISTSAGGRSKVFVGRAAHRTQHRWMPTTIPSASPCKESFNNSALLLEHRQLFLQASPLRA